MATAPNQAGSDASADPGRCTERELSDPVDECLPDGRLNPAAIGFSRRPLHRCNLRGRFPRKKRWDYWCVTSESCVLSITYTDLDYVGLVAVWASALDDLRVVERQAAIPLAWGFAQPETVGGGDIRFDRLGLALGPDVEAYGCLDYGRGIWPWRSAWNWASASGRAGAHTLGLNLGGKWTDGTRSTENGLCIDGCLPKLSQDLVWEYDRANWMAPWSIRTPRSGRVELRFEPVLQRGGTLGLGILSTDLHVMFGRFHGSVVADDGREIGVSQLPGWAEEHLARW